MNGFAEILDLDWIAGVLIFLTLCAVGVWITFFSDLGD